MKQEKAANPYLCVSDLIIKIVPINLFAALIVSAQRHTRQLKTPTFT